MLILSIGADTECDADWIRSFGRHFVSFLPGPDPRGNLPHHILQCCTPVARRAFMRPPSPGGERGIGLVPAPGFEPGRRKAAGF